MRRWVLVVILAVVVASGAGLSAWVLWPDEPPPGDEALRRAEALRADLLSGPNPGATGVKRIFKDRAGVELIATEGRDRRRPPGIEVRFQVKLASITCFQLSLNTAVPDSPLRKVDCEWARTVPPVTSTLPRTFERPLQEALAGVAAGATVDEATVRAAVTGLRLDPRIVVETAADGDGVGVAVRAGDLCFLGLVRPGRAEAWQVPSIQYQPGELSCEPVNAGHGNNPPK